MVHPFRKQQNILHFEARIQSHREEDECWICSVAVISNAAVTGSGHKWRNERDELRVLDNQSHNGILHIKTEAVQNTRGRDDDDKTTCRRAAGVLIIATTAWGRYAFSLRGWGGMLGDRVKLLINSSTRIISLRYMLKGEPHQ